MIVKEGFIIAVLGLSSISSIMAQSNDQPAGQISPDLVGKWCFINTAAGAGDVITDSCITLNSDGTFEAVLDRATLPSQNAFAGIQNTDSGTWWAMGNRISYNSQSNGRSSLLFQKINHPRLNLPMIIVNGVSFITASSHDPW